MNEELKHTIKEKFNKPADVEEISKNLEKVSDDDLAVLKAKIEALQNKTEHDSES